MKTKQWGFTNPIVSPLYGKPPLLLRDMRVQLVIYETDIENVQRVIPEPLEARTNRVITWISEFELGATQGGFKEMAIYLQVKYQNYEAEYEPFLYVNNPLPLTAGREIWGYQKKMADINLSMEQEAVIGKVTRLEHQILKTLVVPEYEAQMSEIPWSRDGVFSLKYIPHAEADGEPLRELVLTPGKFTVQEGKFFGGRASVIHERSEIDPTYRLEPKRILGGFFGQGDLFLPFGKVVHNYPV
ncbi:MAG: acetoacetate decarboxylase family protein [Microcystaceae cyanobacterium]